MVDRFCFLGFRQPRRVYSIFLLAALATALSGCVTIRGESYLVAESEPHATVRFVTYEATSVIRFGDNCKPANLVTDFGEAAVRLGMSAPVPAGAINFSEHRVRSTEPFEFWFAGMHCTVQLRFMPVEGAEYEAIYRGNFSRCSVDVNRLIKANGIRASVPVRDVEQRRACSVLY